MLSPDAVLRQLPKDLLQWFRGRPDVTDEWVREFRDEEQVHRHQHAQNRDHRVMGGRFLDVINDGAGQLAGAVDDHDPDAGLAAVLDPADHDREALWWAWDSEQREARAKSNAEAGGPFTRPAVEPTRTGKWGALHRLGVTLRATPVDDYHLYGRREPQPADPASLEVFSGT